jgi:predicted esterase
MRPWFPLVLMLVLAPAPLLARGRPPALPDVVVVKDGDLERLDAEDAGVGFLYRPRSLAEGAKGGLVVMLHGHGGTPKGVVMRKVAEKMGWWWLSVQGGAQIEAEGRVGYQWALPDVDKVLGLTRWVLANREVDASKVVLYGFSAGGTMVLATWPKAPKLYAGIITNSSPRTPESAHEDARIVVFLGTKDPNFGGAATVRNAFEKRRVGGTLQILEGAVHNDLAEAPYVCLALRWILQEDARGNEIRLPKDPPAEPEGKLRHICVPWSHAEGAPNDLRRSKNGAKSLARKIQKYLERGRAWFPHEAQAWSSDERSAPLGGRVSRERLVEMGVDGEDLDKALEKLKDGKVAGPFESTHGWHLVVPIADPSGDGR